MSIADHFDHVPDQGFSQTIDPRAAQRQFNMSLGLVVILVMAAVGVALTVGIAPLQATAYNGPKRAFVQAPQMVHVRDARLDLSNG
jgi:hypothetical protein